MPSLRNPSDRRGTLGFCWLIYGIARLVVAIVLVLYRGTATLMFGTLISRVPDPFTLMDIFHFLYAVAILLIVLGGFLGILAGVALLGGRDGRALALTAGFLSLSDIPLGTTLGIYTLLVFLP